MINLRGSDIPFNPVFYSYGILFLDKEQPKNYSFYLFCNKSKIDVRSKMYLETVNISLHDYSNFISFMTLNWENNFEAIIHKQSCSHYVYSLLSDYTSNINVSDVNVIEHVKVLCLFIHFRQLKTKRN